MLSILANGLPIINSIFGIFKLIAKIFKISAQSQKLTELLFENLQKKTKSQKFNILEKKENKILSDKKDNNIINIRNRINIINRKNDDNIISSFKLITQNDKEKSKDSIKDKDEPSIIQNIFVNSKQIKNDDFNSNSDNSKVNYIRNINLKNNSINDYNINKEKSLSISPLFAENPLNKYSLNKINLSFFNKSINHNNYYKSQKLFPYKYYLCASFLRNIDYTKKSIFFPNKFLYVYTFICNLVDISSYLILQREFEILKNTFIMDKHRSIVESSKKINVNSHSFNNDMKECLSNKKMSILGRFK